MMGKRSNTALLLVIFACAALILFLSESHHEPKYTSFLAASSGIPQWHRRHLTLIDESEQLPNLFPLRVRDYLGFIAAVAGLMLAAGGGIGGGGILVPIYILVLDFPVKHAIPLASTTVLGGAIANNILNSRKRHPDHPHRSCIDWELIVQMEPMTIAGALVGAEINDLLPDILLVVLLLILLSFTAWKTLAKAHALRQKEDLIVQAERLHLLNHENGNEVSTNNGKQYGSAENATLGKSDPSTIEDGYKKLIRDNSTVEEYLLEQMTWSAFKLTLLFVVVTAINLLKGGVGDGGGPVGLSACNNTCFYFSEFLILAIIFVFSWFGRRSLLQKIHNDEWISSDIAWDQDNTITYPTLAIVAGLVAGMFGIGGGIIKGPLMLALGVHPAVASATSACMILFTSSTATVSYAIFGFLNYDYALLCMLIGFASTVVGQTAMTVLMKKYHQRNSYIAYSIGLVVAISAICMSIESILAIIEQSR